MELEAVGRVGSGWLVAAVIALVITTVVRVIAGWITVRRLLSDRTTHLVSLGVVQIVLSIGASALGRAAFASEATGGMILHALNGAQLALGVGAIVVARRARASGRGS